MNVYDILNVSWRRERVSTNLEKLDEDFFGKIRKYLVHLASQADQEQEVIIAEILRKRWHRATYVLNDLISVRLEKHFRDAIQGNPIPTTLPIEEFKFRDDIEKIHNQFRNSIVENPQSEFIDNLIESKRYQFIEIRKNVDSVTIGDDLMKIGPLEVGDIALITTSYARSLELKDIGTSFEIE